MTNNSDTQMNFYGSVGNVANTVTGDQKTVQHNYAPEQNITQVALEVKKLILQIEQTYPDNASLTREKFIEKKALQVIRDNTSLKERILRALKSGGIEAIKQIVKRPEIDVILAAIEGWNEEV